MTEFKTMKELPEHDRPYEKCVRLGPQALTDPELLAVVLRTGTRGSTSVEMAEEVLNLSRDREGLLGLHQLSLTQLQSIKGIGKVKAVQLKCIGELSKRIARKSAKRGLSLNHP